MYSDVFLTKESWYFNIAKGGSMQVSAIIAKSKTGKTTVFLSVGQVDMDVKENMEKLGRVSTFHGNPAQAIEYVLVALCGSGKELGFIGNVWVH